MVVLIGTKKSKYAGQSCATDNYNDRFVEWGTEDIVVNACFQLCGDGSCSELTPPTTVEVVFSTDAVIIMMTLSKQGEPH